MLYQMIYSSQAVQPMTLAALEQILVDARTGNERRNVTGVLIYVDGVFFQILEGEQDELVSLMASIASDARHTALKVFYEAEITQRTFADWRMAYLDCTPAQMAVWAGLPGTTSIDTVLGDLERDPNRIGDVAGGILAALAP
jgi:hypothetical protein